MLFRPLRTLRSALALQAMIATAVIGMAALMPPAHGTIMLVPLDGQHADSVASWSVAAGASLLGPGPLPRSLVVIGSRAQLAAAAWQHHSIAVTGAFAGCGKGSPA